MSLQPGTRLGPYEVVAQIGAGGMGEVYRARDTKLDRDVAIKVLPEALAADPERIARFQREAKTLAALNHPHIATIHGLEESNGTRALVMELVEGEDLSQRIARGAISFDEAFPIAKQIAEALEAAHELGIIHRDLKPANIKVRPDGTVKVLDFGLAKLTQQGEGVRGQGEAALTMSPTMTSPTMMTGMGVLLGTAAYMSPEQAKGREADKRSDIWAFGAVLYEMLTGRRAFDGEDMTDVLGAVVRLEPNWEALPGDVAPAIRTLLQSCLTKDRRARAGDVAVARFVLEKGTGLAPPVAALRAAPPPPLWRRLAIPSATVLVSAGMASAIVFWFFVPRPTPLVVTRLTMTAPSDAPVAFDLQDRSIAVAPDGSRIAYTSAPTPVYGGSTVRLFLRTLDQLGPRLLAGPGQVREPFFSPDGTWVAFAYPNNRLQKVSASGGPPVPIAMLDGNLRGATWGPDDTIIYTTVNRATGLQRVGANGGESTILTRPNPEKGERDHLWPHLLPGGRAVLFTIAPLGPIENAQIAVLDLRDNSQKIVVRGGSDARYVEGGYLVYGVAGTLRAVPFDLDRLDVRGTPVPVLQQVVTTSADGAANFAVADNGTMTYVLGNGAAGLFRRTLVWVDRAGRSTPLLDREASYRSPRLSPDGKRVAVDLGLQTANVENRDIWVVDTDRGTQTRLTSEPGVDALPLWTRDGKRIVFSSNRAGSANALYSMSADGSGTPEVLTKSSSNQGASSWSPDGRTLAFYDVGGTYDFFTIKPGEAAVRFSETRFREQGPAFSPDGRWLAHSSDETGRDEIYVTPYPGPGGRIAVSTGGGRSPTWSRSGRELFYRNGRQMMTVTIVPGPTLGVGTPRLLFEGDYVQEDESQGANNYDVSADGQRFVMMKDAAQPGQTDAPPPEIIVVQHWLEELKRFVPTK